MHPPIRRPFTRDRLDAVLDFCARNPTTLTSPSLQQRMMTRLVTATDGVIELTRRDETMAVAVAVDGVRSVADCAVLDLLGGAAEAPPVLDAAEAFVRRGERAGLEVPLTGHTAHWRATLDVAASNTAALDLYRRHGFEVVEEIPVYRRLFAR